MKNEIMIVLLLSLSLQACKQETKVSELEKAKMELEAKKQVLKEKQELKSLENEMENVNNELQKLNGIEPRKATIGQINGVDVIMRSSASTKSEKVANFTNGETVSILRKQVFVSHTEGIVNRDIQIDDQVTLKLGKAILIKKYVTEHDAFLLEYDHPTSGKQTVLLPAYVIDKTENESWYQVQRSNGTNGWVYGKFIREI
jgi:hypothetical protein